MTKMMCLLCETEEATTVKYTDGIAEDAEGNSIDVKVAENVCDGCAAEWYDN